MVMVAGVSFKKTHSEGLSSLCMYCTGSTYPCPTLCVADFAGR